MLTAQTVALGVSVADWEEAVRAAGKLLVDSGAVEARYVDAMIAMVGEIGPYIVIAPGVALPHARPSEGAHRPAMALITLASPVEFGNEYNDPVDLVIAFAAGDADAHLEALTGLARMLEREDLLIAVRAASTVDQVLAAVAQAAEIAQEIARRRARRRADDEDTAK